MAQQKRGIYLYRVNEVRTGKGGGQMIGIIKNDFQDVLVNEHVLDSLIASNKIVAFRRSTEWVVIGRDSIREQHTFYQGQERRRIIYGNDFSMK
jgi:hypothetical protein